MAVPRLMHGLTRLGLPLLLSLAPAASAQSRLLTLEANQQTANSETGVITASGNVRLLHPDRGLVATGRQAQYFSREQRIVLSGDVDVVQDDGHSLRAEQVTVLLDQQLTLATPSPGQQVISSWSLQDEEAGITP